MRKAQNGDIGGNSVLLYQPSVVQQDTQLLSNKMESETFSFIGFLKLVA